MNVSEIPHKSNVAIDEKVFISKECFELSILLSIFVLSISNRQAQLTGLVLSA